jgi:hypothetical protein
MQGSFIRVSAILLFALTGARALAQEVEEKVEVFISVSEQKLVVLRDGMWTHRFPVSTSKFGLGDSYGSYKTPLGRLRVCEKIGAGLPPGSVMRHRSATGEVIPVNARGRDPIVTRIIWLDGLDACNANARSRGIYIHGTAEEEKIGKPVSYGCIRMRSRDVLDLFEAVPLGTVVTIQQDRLPHVKRWSAPPPPPIIASKEPVKKETKLAVKPTPEPVKQKEPVLVAERTVEKISPKPEAKPAAKPAPVPAPAKERTFVVQRVAERTSPMPEAVPQSTRLVIKSSGTDDHDVRPADFGASAFKGSILFADLPGHGVKTSTQTASSER